MKNLRQKVWLIISLIHSSLSKGNQSMASFEPGSVFPFDLFRSMTQVEAALPNHSSYVLVTYDPESCIHCYGYAKRLLTNLGQMEFVRDFEVGLGLINTQDFIMPNLKKGKQLASGLAFIQNNQARFFEDFRLLAEQGRPYQSYHDKILGQTLNFLYQFLKPLKELTSLEMLESELEKNNVIGIFTGRQINNSFDLFKEFVKQHSSFPFYYTLNETLTQQIFEHFKIFVSQAFDHSFLVARSKNSISDFDSNQLGILPNFSSLEELKFFLVSHRYKKLITDTTWPELFSAVKKEGISVLLMISNSTEEGRNYSAEFKAAVQSFQRAALFVHIERPHPMIEDFVAGKLEENTVLFIFQAGKGTGSTIMIIPMKEQINRKSIALFFRTSLLVKKIVENLNLNVPQIENSKNKSESEYKESIDDGNLNTEEEAIEDQKSEEEEEQWPKNDPKFQDLFLESNSGRLFGTAVIIIMLSLIK